MFATRIETYWKLFHRCWRSDLHKGSCVLASTSVDHPGASPGDDLRAVVTVSCYLIEPCGEGLTRLTHVSSADVRQVITSSLNNTVSLKWRNFHGYNRIVHAGFLEKPRDFQTVISLILGFFMMILILFKKNLNCYSSICVFFIYLFITTSYIFASIWR